MTTLEVHVWAENISVGVSQCPAEAMGIWQDTCGLTTKQIDNKMMERVLDNAQSTTIINTQDSGRE
jgi:hypothetical protein